MTYLPEPQNEDDRLVQSWWRSLTDDQRETYDRLRASKGGLERLDAHLARQREGTGCGFVVFLLMVGIVGAGLLAGPSRRRASGVVPIVRSGTCSSMATSRPSTGPQNASCLAFW
jgi:hypothetical protein